MKSILATLSPQTKETLISWCEDHSYTEVKALAAKAPSEGGLGLNISRSTLNRLYTTHNIADSKETRTHYADALGLDANGKPKTFLDAAQENLEQRLLELSARPNPGVPEIRLLSQVITKLRNLQLGERRVQVAEKRETRMGTPPPEPPKKLLPPSEIKHRIRVLLGKEQPRDSEDPSTWNSPSSDPTRWSSSSSEKSQPAMGRAEHVPDVASSFFNHANVSES